VTAPIAVIAMVAAAGAASCRTGPDRLPRCEAPPAGARHLESFRDVEVPATYWLEMAFSEEQWRPAEPLPMPAHHATRIELIHGSELASLSAHRKDRVRFTIEIVSKDVQPVAGRHAWRATYVARVVSVCMP
jgi:hypothetical protein